MMSIPSLDVEALSGICGSISIACWIVVFSPQIIENFRRGSADGLSTAFIVIWLVGDIFNIVGGVYQHVLPTMLVLAVYYTVADVVLLGQVWWYRGFGLGKAEGAVEGGGEGEDCVEDDVERRPLLRESDRINGFLNGHERRRSSSAVRPYLVAGDERRLSSHTSRVKVESPGGASSTPIDKSQSTLRKVFLNSGAIIVVCVAGVLGWWLTSGSSHGSDNEDLRGKLHHFDITGQVFGYLCAVLYLCSRVPQLLLNYRRKSTEGISMLFFVFACIGNLTYSMSIFAFNPAPRCVNGPEHCASGEQKMIYLRYIAVNASWIVGSLGTVKLDLAVFVQHFLYMKN